MIFYIVLIVLFVLVVVAASLNTSHIYDQDFYEYKKEKNKHV